MKCGGSSKGNTHRAGWQFLDASKTKKEIPLTVNKKVRKKKK